MCQLLFCLILFFSNTNITERIVGFSGIGTRIVGEGKQADHLTTTTARERVLLCKIELCHGSLRQNFYKLFKIPTLSSIHTSVLHRSLFNKMGDTFAVAPSTNRIES